MRLSHAAVAVRANGMCPCAPPDGLCPVALGVSDVGPDATITGSCEDDLDGGIEGEGLGSYSTIFSASVGTLLTDGGGGGGPCTGS